MIMVEMSLDSSSCYHHEKNKQTKKKKEARCSQGEKQHLSKVGCNGTHARKQTRAHTPTHNTHTHMHTFSMRVRMMRRKSTWEVASCHSGHMLVTERSRSRLRRTGGERESRASVASGCSCAWYLTRASCSVHHQGRSTERESVCVCMCVCVYVCEMRTKLEKSRVGWRGSMRVRVKRVCASLTFIFFSSVMVYRASPCPRASRSSSSSSSTERDACTTTAAATAPATARTW